MENQFDGIVPSILKGGNTYVYKPMDFNLHDLSELLKNDNKPIEYVMPVSSYMLAVMRNDKEQIAYHEKRMRVDRFRELKSLINKWGIFKAKVIAWLNKKGRNSTLNHSDYWRITDYGKWQYLGIGKGEMESVSLTVILKEDKFSITLHANDCDGYCADIYTKILAENVSFKSVINHINYISKKLEKNAYA